MSQPSSLHLKILSLAVVVWGLMSSLTLTLQRASWVPWLALVMLMLLEAYSGDAKPASWSRWSTGLVQLVGPAMLPYYAVLLLSLAIGPDLLHHGERAIPRANAASYPLATSLPSRPTVLTGAPNTINPPQPGRPQLPPNNKFPRPATTPSGAAISNIAGPSGKPPIITAKPQQLSPATGAAKPVAPPSSTPATSTAPTSPPSSAKPPAISTPAK